MSIIRTSTLSLTQPAFIMAFSDIGGVIWQRYHDGSTQNPRHSDDRVQTRGHSFLARRLFLVIEDRRPGQERP